MIHNSALLIAITDALVNLGMDRAVIAPILTQREGDIWDEYVGPMLDNIMAKLDYMISRICDQCGGLDANNINGKMLCLKCAASKP